MQRAAGPTPLGPRKRKKINYADSPAHRRKLEIDTPSKVQEEIDNATDNASLASGMSSQSDDELEVSLS